MASDTIAAIATPPGIGGVGIVRLSGPRVRHVCEGVLGRVPAARRATLASFRHADGGLIDQGIALYFPAPGSYTGEDVLELQGHGGPVVMDILLARCLELGARLARPGEFTERAYLNGKLDLAQAEAVADLIESSSALAARLAGRSLQGLFSRRIEALVERLIAMRTYVEATLDFPEEELGASAGREVLDGLVALIDLTGQILGDARQGALIREGLGVVILGPPNAGKSSLLNALSGQDAAIVTPIPGTTRDLLKLDIEVDGLPIRIIDTAGLRHSDDLIEREGVKRACAQLGQADLVLWVYDAADGPDPLTRATLAEQGRVTRVRNKIDLLGIPPAIAEVETGPEIALSALTGDGLDLLRAHLKERAGLSSPSSEGAFIARRRHLEALGRGLACLESARRAHAGAAGAELVAEDLLGAQRAFGEITGQFTSEELLGRIFATFCIGK